MQFPCGPCNKEITQKTNLTKTTVHGSLSRDLIIKQTMADLIGAEAVKLGAERAQARRRHRE